ncbi:hypothetical protein IFM89_030419 [Coptis chinensis]|uniref:K+ potassium transporter integral membrane domain-containing protein n=1 Tax=Coptis chinensis TaxID=261450 RepID=A0A835LTI4_9MAGN|nr:hypothetical protein IFM89_030419 [Coptis chinensis]
MLLILPTSQVQAPSVSSANDYRSADPLYWPTLLWLLLLFIIASQAMISKAFAIISQSPFKLGCFPKVKVVHTSAKSDGELEKYTFLSLCYQSCLPDH